MHANTVLTKLAVSDTGFVFDPCSGATYNVNMTGLTILKGIQAGQSRTALLHNLRSTFESDQRDLSRDVDEFVQMLRQAGLLPAHFVLES